MAASIPLSRPWLGPEETAAVAEVLASGWLVQGPKVAAFEAALAERLGVERACAVANGTAALQLALLAAGIGPGDRVATASYSFVATANAVRACGAEPVFVDIDPASGNLSPAELERCLAGEPIAAVVVVHQVGMPADLPALAALARAAGVPLIEDAACALGSQWRDGDGRWRPVGDPGGDFVCFSFHPRKLITCGEGGAVICRDPEADRLLRQLRDHGREDGRCLRPGFNQRMSDVHAAIALVQLGRLDDILADRRRAVDRYRAGLAGVPGLTLPVEPDGARTNWQSLIVMVDGDRDALVAGLAAEGIAAQPGIGCAHRAEPYLDSPAGALDASEDACDRGLTLPLYPQIAGADIDRVCDSLRRLVTSPAATP